MAEVFLSIGSNIEPEKNIPLALVDLKNLFGPLRCSSLYETEAVGFEGPVFHNLVAAFDSKLAPLDIAAKLRAIEERHGRTRNSQKFSSRTLDVDLILYGDLVTQDGGIELPRQEITRYAFVLEPLAELAPKARHPINHRTYSDLWSELQPLEKAHARKIQIHFP